MSYQKLHLGIAPSHERAPTMEVDGRDVIFRIGATWKEQILRLFPPPEGCFVRLEPSSHPRVPEFEVVATFNEDDEDALAWSWEIETSIPLNWDKQAVDALVKAKWLSGLTRS